MVLSELHHFSVSLMCCAFLPSIWPLDSSRCDGLIAWHEHRESSSLSKSLSEPTPELTVHQRSGQHTGWPFHFTTVRRYLRESPITRQTTLFFVSSLLSLSATHLCPSSFPAFSSILSPLSTSAPPENSHLRYSLHLRLPAPLGASLKFSPISHSIFFFLSVPLSLALILCRSHPMCDSFRWLEAMMSWLLLLSAKRLLNLQRTLLAREEGEERKKANTYRRGRSSRWTRGLSLAAFKLRTVRCRDVHTQQKQEIIHTVGDTLHHTTCGPFAGFRQCVCLCVCENVSSKKDILNQLYLTDISERGKGSLKALAWSVKEMSGKVFD